MLTCFAPRLTQFCDVIAVTRATRLRSPLDRKLFKMRKPLSENMHVTRFDPVRRNQVA